MSELGPMTAWGMQAMSDWKYIADEHPEDDEEVLVSRYGLVFMAIYRTDEPKDYWEMDADGETKKKAYFKYWLRIPEPPR